MQLTPKAIEALESRYHALPRALLAVFKDNPLSWSECLVIAELCSKYNLAESDDGIMAVGREWLSIRDLERATGLSRRAVIQARQRLISRKAIMPPEYGDDGMEMCLHTETGLYESALPQTAVEVLKSTSDPPREWKETRPRRARKPKSPPVHKCDSKGCTIDTGGVHECDRDGCTSATGGGARLQQTGCTFATCNDLNHLPKALTKSSDLNPVPKTKTKTPPPSGAGVALGDGSSDSKPRKLRAEDLLNTDTLLAWFAERYPNRQSEHAKLAMLAASQAALRCRGARNPVGLFVDIVKRSDPHSLASSDWDTASVRWKAHNHPPGQPSPEAIALVAATRARR